MKLPESVEKEFFIVYDHTFIGHPDLMIRVFDRDMYSHDADRVLLASFKMNIDIPGDVNINSALIANLEETKKGIQAEYSVKLQKVDEEIQKLKALPNLSEQS